MATNRHAPPEATGEGAESDKSDGAGPTTLGEVYARLERHLELSRQSAVRVAKALASLEEPVARLERIVGKVQVRAYLERREREGWR
ncbi:MAG TPA: hypothetical protein VK455_02550 [Thermoplasmata archaeon]|nr:hypothetical protein [Thermoplasmata archaeon]